MYPHGYGCVWPSFRKSVGVAAQLPRERTDILRRRRETEALVINDSPRIAGLDEEVRRSEHASSVLKLEPDGPLSTNDAVITECRSHPSP